MAYKVNKKQKRGRPEQEFFVRKLNGNLFPKGATFHKFDKEKNAIILKRGK